MRTFSELLEACGYICAPEIDPKINELQAVLLLHRLPPEPRDIILGSTVLHVEQSMAACCVFAGMGLHVPVPCLAPAADGTWFSFVNQGAS